jgi:hypothetical protein
MQNTLNRSIIVDDIIFDNESKSEICVKIDKVKALLTDRGAKKGDLITISILPVSTYHVASIFACAELGLKIIILDSPATELSLPYTKLALHGPSDYFIYDSSLDMSGIYDGLHDKMIRLYGGKSIDVRKTPQLDKNGHWPEQTYNVSIEPTDPFLLSSTSGSTKPSRPILFSHKEVYEISKRNVDVFEFKSDSKVIHSRNLHHASALLTSLLPALMKAHVHGSFAIGHDLSQEENEDMMQGLHDLLQYPPSHIMIPNKAELMNFLESFSGPFKRTVNINMCGFALDQSFADLTREYNVKFHSHYGSIDTAIPLLVNFVDENSVVKENGLGVLPDDFYEFDGKEIMCELWDKPRYIEDDLYMIDDQFFIEPRKLNLPDDIDLTPFMQDTKINMEQLRGHETELLCQQIEKDLHQRVAILQLVSNHASRFILSKDYSPTKYPIHSED